jgi:hypothetical protein
MEKLPINSGNGQSYGFVLYRHAGLPVNVLSTLQIKDGAFYDMGIVLLDGERQTDKLTSVIQLSEFGYWELE